jgi:hypothetical protein
VVLNLAVLKDLVAAERVVLALKLHFLKFFLDFLLNTEEFRFLALHRALSRFIEEFLKAFVVESVLAAFALNRVHQNG